MQFTKPYMENDQVLITPKESGITSFEQMKNKRLGAQNGSSGCLGIAIPDQVDRSIVQFKFLH